MPGFETRSFRGFAQSLRGVDAHGFPGIGSACAHLECGHSPATGRSGASRCRGCPTAQVGRPRTPLLQPRVSSRRQTPPVAETTPVPRQSATHGSSQSLPAACGGAPRRYGYHPSIDRRAAARGRDPDRLSGKRTQFAAQPHTHTHTLSLSLSLSLSAGLLQSLPVRRTPAKRSRTMHSPARCGARMGW